MDGQWKIGNGGLKVVFFTLRYNKFGKLINNLAQITGTRPDEVSGGQIQEKYWEGKLSVLEHSTLTVTW